MRVAIFTDNNFEKVNGVTTTLHAVLRWRPRDIEPRVYTAADVGIERPDYLALRSVGVGIPFYSEMKMYWPRFFAWLRRARADGFDLVHFTTPGPIGLAAMFTAWRLGLPMIGSFHTQLAEYTALLSGSPWLGGLMREYQRWPYGKCARILVPSEATRALLVAARIRPEKLQIWTRGVDTTRFAPQHRSDALRAQWGVGDTRLALLYVGRLSREKGLDVMPSIARRLAAEGMAHRFVFVGDGPMRAELEASCPDAVFTGMLPHEEVAVMMASADLFLFPSRTDTLGNVVLEAQASGLPVLVSDEGGPRENMRPGVTGFECVEDARGGVDALESRATRSSGAVEMDTASATPSPLKCQGRGGRGVWGMADMASRVVELARDPARRLAMGEAARGYALDRSWPRALAPLYRAYRDVTAQAASASATPRPRDLEATWPTRRTSPSSRY